MNLNKLNLKIINLQTNRHFSDSGTCTRSKIGVPSIKKMFLSFLAGENSLFISFMKLLRFSSLNFFNSFPTNNYPLIHITFLLIILKYFPGIRL